MVRTAPNSPFLAGYPTASIEQGALRRSPPQRCGLRNAGFEGSDAATVQLFAALHVDRLIDPWIRHPHLRIIKDPPIERPRTAGTAVRSNLGIRCRRRTPKLRLCARRTHGGIGVGAVGPPLKYRMVLVDHRTHYRPNVERLLGSFLVRWEKVLLTVVKLLDDVPAERCQRRGRPGRRCQRGAGSVLPQTARRFGALVRRFASASAVYAEGRCGMGG
jgi:hypothetical protein